MMRYMLDTMNNYCKNPDFQKNKHSELLFNNTITGERCRNDYAIEQVNFMYKFSKLWINLL